MPDMMLSAKVVSEDDDQITLQVKKDGSVDAQGVYYSIVILDERQQPRIPWLDTGEPIP